jgi:ABC-2 type transport system permease protein
VSQQSAQAAAPASASLHVSASRPATRVPSLTAFAALLARDFRVLRRELIPFAVRILMQPLLFLFVFTYLMPRIGQGAGMVGGSSFATVLLPGLMAVAIMFTGIAAVALPLSNEFGITREIDDRVMSPLPVYAVALEKICFSAAQSIVGALLVIPLVYIVPSTPVHVHVSSWAMFISTLLLSGMVSGALGLAIGSNVKPRQIGLLFSIVVVPITFLGCVYYPWALLSHVRWLQIVVLVNPIVYMSEGLRTALTPGVPHMPAAAILAGLLVSLGLLGTLGFQGFLRRVIS